MTDESESVIGHCIDFMLDEYPSDGGSRRELAKEWERYKEAQGIDE